MGNKAGKTKGDAGAAAGDTAAAGTAIPQDGRQHVLCVGLTQCRGLKAADRRVLGASSDPYVVVTVELADGSTLPPQQSKVIMGTLNPVFNQRFDFNCGVQPPRRVNMRVMDFDAASKHDTLGVVSYDVTTADWAPECPSFQWISLADSVPGAKGDIQVQIAGRSVDPSIDASAQMRLDYIDSLGLLTLRIDDIHHLHPGPAAAKALGHKALASGDYDLKTVLTYGVRRFAAKHVRGKPLPGDRSTGAAVFDVASALGGAHRDDTTGSVVEVDQDCRIWVREGQQRYMPCVTLYALPRRTKKTTNAAGKRVVMVTHGRPVTLGSGFLKAEEVLGGGRHIFHVYITEPGEHLTDASSADVNKHTISKRGLPDATATATTTVAVAGGAAAGVAAAATASVADGGAAAAGDADADDEADALLLASASPLDENDGSGFRGAEGGAGGSSAHVVRTVSGGLVYEEQDEVEEDDDEEAAAGTPRATATAAAGAAAVTAGVSGLTLGASGRTAAAGASLRRERGHIGLLHVEAPSPTTTGTPFPADAVTSAAIGGAAATADAGAASLSASSARDSATTYTEHTSGLDAYASGAAKPPPVVARIVLRGVFETKENVERWFFARLMHEFDADKSGSLDSTEMLAMINQLGSIMTVDDLEALFKRLDTSGDGKLDGAELLAWFHSPEFQTTPMAYSLLAFLADGRKGLDELVNDVTRFVRSAGKDTSAGAGVLAIMEEDGRVTVADRGLKIIDRRTGMLMDEHIPSFVATAINLMYHSSMGSVLTNTGAVRRLLHSMSAREGSKMDRPESREKIEHFIALHNLNVDEMALPPSEYKTFNHFFYRELKPGARPIDAPFDDGVVTSPADCRMVVFPTLLDAAKIWVKGAAFTVESLLGPACADVAPLFLGGSLCIARLAPQDYHRWHLPVSGRLGRRHPIDGALYTVNPIAIRRRKPDVYTENKREVLLVHTKQFGLVAMVAVGATIVGSINIVLPDGSFGIKGDCHGYFAFGGSTVLVLFQPGTVKFDADLAANSEQPLETLVRVGEKIGTAVSAVPHDRVRGALADDDADYVAYRARAAAASAATATAATAGGAVAATAAAVVAPAAGAAAASAPAPATA